jgi:hypothetical protein
MILLTSAGEFIVIPLTSFIISPNFSPPLSAGLSELILITNAPPYSDVFIETPKYPFLTF